LTIELVSLIQAKLDRNIDLSDPTHDDALEMKIIQASNIVMDYLKVYTVATIPQVVALGTSPETYTIPPLVQAATLLVLGELFENREASLSNILSDGVMNILERFRDPALA
jgi:hypothetical protein